MYVAALQIEALDVVTKIIEAVLAGSVSYFFWRVKKDAEWREKITERVQSLENKHAVAEESRTQKIQDKVEHLERLLLESRKGKHG